MTLSALGHDFCRLGSEKRVLGARPCARSAFLDAMPKNGGCSKVTREILSRTFDIRTHFFFG